MSAADSLCLEGLAVPPEMPAFSRSQVDRAGKRLKENIDDDAAFNASYDVLSNWRAAHAYPADRFRILLKRNACSVDPNATVTQRLKRVRSIAIKLLRKNWRLTQLQDIAGCRATVRDVADVGAIIDKLRRSNTKHELLDVDDYIDNPQDTGYRSVHLIWKFCSEDHPSLDRMMCEMQVRTRAQNAWASAVEMCGFFRDQDLKNGEGDADWLRFFKVFSALLARAEKASPVPGVDGTDEQLRDEIVHFTNECKVLDWLHGYRATLSMKKFHELPSSGYYYVLILNTKDRTTSHRAFKVDDFAQANEAYKAAEIKYKGDSSVQVVMVSASSFDEMRSAYASFFGSATTFYLMLESLVKKESLSDFLTDRFRGRVTQLEEHSKRDA